MVFDGTRVNPTTKHRPPQRIPYGADQIYRRSVRSFGRHNTINRYSLGTGGAGNLDTAGCHDVEPLGVGGDQLRGRRPGKSLAEATGLTTGQIAARLSRLCIAVDPHDAERRYTTAVADRRVVLEQTVSGTGNLLGLELPADRITSIAKHINRVARSLRRKAEPRTMDQLRADIYLDLLEGTANGRHGASSKHAGAVDIQVGLETLAGLAEAPGELNDFGPVIADIARQITAQQAGARWRYTVTAPDGTIHAGTTRRRPTAEQRRAVEAAYPTCVFPGCRMPAASCDLDHLIPYAEGGPTDVHYLAPACRHTITVSDIKADGDTHGYPMDATNGEAVSAVPTPHPPSHRDNKTADVAHLCAGPSDQRVRRAPASGKPRLRTPVR